MIDVTTITEPQAIFDYVANHLINQGKPAMDGDSCMYRGPEGTMCAVGCLLSDDEYDPDMEESNIWTVIREFDIERFNKNANLLADLQDAHDAYFDTVDRLREKLTRVAEDHGLTVNF